MDCCSLCFLVKQWFNLNDNRVCKVHLYNLSNARKSEKDAVLLTAVQKTVTLVFF